MHDIDRGQRVALRAKLLLGVAGATAAASTAAFADQPTAPPANPQKWAPYSDFGGSVGSGMVGGKFDFFVPVFQNLDLLAFLNLGVGTETKANVLYNIGAGYRTKIDPDWIVGIYAGHDGSQLADNNTFGQTSFSAELMSADWDVRLNGYLADNAAEAGLRARPASTSTARRSRFSMRRTSAIRASTAKSAIASSRPTTPMCAFSSAASISATAIRIGCRWGRTSTSTIATCPAPRRAPKRPSTTSTSSAISRV